MKRAVSVMMAIAMILCMCPQVFAEPKAYISYGFSDFDDIAYQYVNAIEIALDFEILSGYSDGTFRPKNGLTRGAAAKIIANANLQSDYTAQSATFKDVPLSHTFANCIAYCVSRQLISGYADGTFQPASPLTGYAFAKMLLNDIRYAKDASRYTGASWKSAVSADAAATGISDLIPTLDKAITREEAAQMWFASWNYEAELPPESRITEEPTTQHTKELCPICYGDGDCTECFGSGKEDCDKCFGSGECLECGGSGKIEYLGYDSSIGMSTIKERNCTYCHGRGDCSKCRGSGAQNCFLCRGNGKCEMCNGSGYVYT